MTLYPIQASFARGELSPRLHARSDIEHYQTGLAICENFIVLRQGGLRRRAGTRYITTTKFTTGGVRLIGFVFSALQTYVIELGNLYARFFTLGGRVMNGVNPYEIVTPWAAADVGGLQFVQEGDVMYITHADYSPRKLKRFSELNWQIEEVGFEDGPYLDLVKSGVTLKASGTGDLATGGTSSGSAGSGVSSTLAFDNVDSTDWDSGTDLGEGWLGYSFGAAKRLEGYVLQASTTVVTFSDSSGTSGATALTTKYKIPGALRAPRTWTFEGSNEAVATADLVTNWTVLDTRAGETGWGDGERRYYVFVNETAYKHYRIKITNSNAPDRPVSIAKLAFQGAGADAVALTLTASGILGVNDDAGFQASDVGRHVRFLSADAYWHWFTITAYTSATVVTAELQSPPLPSTASTSSWRLGAFSVTTGWPARVSLYQERLVYARTDEQPQTLWFSKVGDFEDFGVSIPLKDDDAISLTINDVGEIQWLLDAGELVAGTISAIRPIGPSDKSKGFSATNFSQGRQAKTGASAIRPASAGEANLFVSLFGKSLHEMAYNFDVQGYITPDVTVLSEHMYRPGVRELAYAAKPNAIMWSAMEDGTLVGMTYEREQKMVAQHRHSMGGDGLIASQCVLPGLTRDESWFIVERTGLRSIELMEADFEGGDQKDAFYVDCGLTYSGAPATVISGLAHLNGKQVAILADGAPEPTQTVVGGAVTIQQASSVVQVGLPYTSRAETLPLAVGVNDGSALGRQKVVRSVIVSLLEAGQFLVGGAGPLEEVVLRDTADDMDTAIPLKTGFIKTRVSDRWDNGGVVTMEVSDPVPVTIRSVTPVFEPGG